MQILNLTAQLFVTTVILLIRFNHGIFSRFVPIMTTVCNGISNTLITASGEAKRYR
jgi:hypothetical protein